MRDRGRGAGEGAALLREIAVPRLVGSPNHATVREVLKRELHSRGLVVMEQRFSAKSLLHHLARVPLEGTNLIGVRPRTRVTTWLVAHYDSKGQPLSMAARLVAAALAALGAVEVLHLAVRALLGVPAGALDAALGALGAVGVVLLVGNRVTDHSPGAVDNASGIVTALAALDALPPEAAVGVIFPDAEEYGLQGAKALVRERANLLRDTTVINFDGIDDRGRTIAVVHAGGSTVAAVARALDARRARWLPVLVDGLALARAARECVTIMRGDWGTARVVHTRSDTPERLTLEGVRAVSAGVARVLAELSPG